MKIRYLTPALLLAGCGAVSSSEGTGSSQTALSERAPGRAELIGTQLFWARDVKTELGRGGSRNANLSYHAGPVLRASKTEAVWWDANGGFWGTSGSPANPYGDQTGLVTFLEGFGSTAYEGIATQYYDSAGAIANSSSFLGQVWDGSGPPPTGSSSNTAAAAAFNEACALFPSPDPSAVYFFFSSSGRGSQGYCAFHTWGTCNGVSLQVAYILNVAGDSGCDVNDPTTGHSQPLASEANLTAHELMEAITDPQGSAWFDSRGAEIGDKCAWKFASTPLGTGIVPFSNGSEWMVQEEWSNASGGCAQGY